MCVNLIVQIITTNFARIASNIFCARPWKYNNNYVFFRNIVKQTKNLKNDPLED